MNISEHTMITVCFGACIGWMLGPIVLCVIELIHHIIRKVKARRNEDRSDRNDETDPHDNA